MYDNVFISRTEIGTLMRARTSQGDWIKSYDTLRHAADDAERLKLIEMGPALILRLPTQNGGSYCCEKIDDVDFDGAGFVWSQNR